MLIKENIWTGGKCIYLKLMCLVILFSLKYKKTVFCENKINIYRGERGKFSELKGIEGILKCGVIQRRFVFYYC